MGRNFIDVILKNEKLYLFLEIMMAIVISMSNYIPLGNKSKITLLVILIMNSLIGYNLKKYKFFKINSILFMLISSSLFFRIYYLDKLRVIICMIALILYFYKLISLFEYEKYLFPYIIMMGSLIRIEKMLIYKTFPENKFFTVVTALVIVGLCINNINVKEIYNKLKNIDELNKLIILIYPFFLVRRSNSREILFLFLITTILFIIKNKDKISDKIYKEKLLFISILVPVLVFLLSITLKGYSSYTKGHYFDYVCNTILFLLILINFVSSYEIKKLIDIITLVSFIPICLVYPTLIESGFAFGRISGFWDVSIYSFTILVLATTLMYNMLSKDEYNLLFIIGSLYILILFSGTRMVWLVSILVFMTIAVILMKKRVICIVFTLICMGYFSWIKLPDSNPIKDRAQAFFHIKENSSSGARIYMYKEAIMQFKESPLIGNGYTTYGKQANSRHSDEEISGEDKHKKYEAYRFRYHAHSNFFELLCGTGLIGIISFYSFNLYLFYLMVINRKKAKDLCNIGILVFLCFHLYGISDVTLYMSKVTEIYFYSIGIVLSYIYSIKFLEKSEKGSKNETKII